MSAIFLLNAAEELVELRESPYDSEAVLQDLLAKFPNLLTDDLGVGVESSRWLLLKREMPVASEGWSSGTWSLDHLFLDQHGIPTLVEVKQSRNTDIRRAVVGQILDYAANAVVYWPVEKLRATFESGPSVSGLSPEDRLAAFIGRDASPEVFWQSVATNLQAQRLRLIFVADEIPPELRRIIEFLNGQMSPAEVLGIEVKQYSGKGLRTLVPKLIGRTADAEARKGAPVSRSDWTWDIYESELKVPAARTAVGRILEAAVGTFITSEQPTWRIAPRKGYYAILRPGGFKVGVIDVWWRKAPRFGVKLPASPSELGLTSPYPGLQEDWDPNEKEWGWTVPAAEVVPDVKLALEMALPFHPSAGSMTVPAQFRSQRS